MQLGYERYDTVEAEGQFSSRGGIIDIAVDKQTGIRIEFWGDEIDSIRYFNMENQRSNQMVQEVLINPATEFVLERSLEEIGQHIIQTHEQTEAIVEDVEQIKAGNYLEKIDRYFNNFYIKQNTLIDYFDKDTVIFLDEISKIKARIENILKDNKNLGKSLLEKEKIVPDSIVILNDYIQFLKLLETKQVIYLEKQDIGFVDKQSMHAKRNGYSFSYREVNFFRSSMDLCLQEIQKAILEKKVVLVLGGNLKNTKKVYNWLLEKEVKCVYENSKTVETTPGVVVVASGELSAGFESFDFSILVISLAEIFTPSKPKKVVITTFKQGEAFTFSDLKPR